MKRILAKLGARDRAHAVTIAVTRGILRLEDWSAAGRTLDQLGAVWCRLMHHSTIWPMRQTYQCRTCGRSYLVRWAAGRATLSARPAIGRERTVQLEA